MGIGRGAALVLEGCCHCCWLNICCGGCWCCCCLWCCCGGVHISSFIPVSLLTSNWVEGGLMLEKLSPSAEAVVGRAVPYLQERLHSILWWTMTRSFFRHGVCTSIKNIPTGRKCPSGTCSGNESNACFEMFSSILTQACYQKCLHFYDLFTLRTVRPLCTMCTMRTLCTLYNLWTLHTLYILHTLGTTAK